MGTDDPRDAPPRYDPIDGFGDDGTTTSWDGPWRVRALAAPRDTAAVAGVFAAAADHAILVNGAPPHAGDGADFLADAPPGRDPGQLIKCGLYQGESPAQGVLEAVPDHPEPGAWFVGLILLRPEARGQGGGKLALRWIDTRAARAGASRLVLPVIVANAAARGFALAQGFEEARLLPPRPFGRLMHAVIEFERAIGYDPRRQAR